MLRIMVVDDSAVYRKILTMAVETTKLARVETAVANGAEAILQMQKRRFDLILLDIHLPDMSGIQVLTQLKQINPLIKVVMISSSTSTEAAKLTVQALEMGAVDFISKPLEESFEKNLQIVSEYLNRLLAPFAKPNQKYISDKKTADEPSSERKTRRRRFDLAVICSSTGGPAALEQIIPQLPPSYRVPLLIVQHMPRDFTRVLADSLNHRSALHVVEAAQDETMEPRCGYVAAGGKHLVLKKRKNEYVFQLEESEYVNGVRPAADKLFESLANVAPGMRVLVVVLTGMGVDATAGIRQLKQKADCYSIVQDEASSVVFGMPRSVIDHGLADEVLPLSAIANRMIDLVQLGVEGFANESN